MFDSLLLGVVQMCKVNVRGYLLKTFGWICKNDRIASGFWNLDCAIIDTLFRNLRIIVL